MLRPMQRTAFLSSITILAASAAISMSTEVDRDKVETTRLLALGGEGFSIHRTDHFLIASDSNADRVYPLADRLETTYLAVGRFCEEMKLPIPPLPRKLPVLIFNRHSDFERYAHKVGFHDPVAPGFYHPQDNTVAFCNLLDFPKLRAISLKIEQAEMLPDSHAMREQIKQWRSQRDAIIETFNRLVIQHEAAHQIWFNIGVLSREVEYPTWLVEGLACQFEVSSQDDVNQMRLADFREALGVAPDAKAIEEASLSDAKAAKRFLSLEELVADEEFDVADENWRRFQYSQAWALVAYLSRTRRQAIKDYLRSISEHKNAEHSYRGQRIAQFESIFGSIDQKFERSWIDYVLDLPLNPQDGR